MAIREAVSLILTNDQNEIYLARRSEKLRFFGGYWSCPGGGLHDSDRAELAPEASSNVARDHVAAAREALEELGLCFFPTGAIDVDALRREVLDRPEAFGTALDERDVSVESARLTPILRLLTPSFLPIRFDTRFYTVRLTAAERPAIWPGELVDGGWATATEWLLRWTRGELLLPPPVVLLLQILAEHGFEAARPAMVELEETFAKGRIHPIYFNPAVRLLPLRTPTLPPATHTNAYAIGQEHAYLVDPATPHAEEQARLMDAIDEMVEEGRQFRAILLTHHHPDHVGAVAAVVEHTGLPVWAHPTTRALLESSVATDGDLIPAQRLPLGRSPDGVDGWEMEVIFTPGHAAGHVCFFEARYGSLLAGDMVSTLSSILIHPDDGDMAQYLSSLEDLTTRDVRMVFPAHGPASERGRGLLEYQLDHRRHREVSVLAALARGPREVDGIVGHVYPDLDPRMASYAGLSVQSILAKLVSEGRVEWDGSSASLI